MASSIKRRATFACSWPPGGALRSTACSSMLSDRAANAAAAHDAVVRVQYTEIPDALGQGPLVVLTGDAWPRCRLRPGHRVHAGRAGLYSSRTRHVLLDPANRGEGFQLKIWRGGPQAGQPKLSPVAKGLWNAD